MAAMPLYGKILKKSSPPVPVDRLPRNLIYSIGASCLSKFVQVDLNLFYGKVKFYNLGFSIVKRENTGFSETIAACDLKVG